ncbi:hypothetical protein [Clostridium ihumii]|uniref:hypothetical protein n=1 Tax=Clostridium ihumii TaxID=1470356 RepID=UPI003D349184
MNKVKSNIFFILMTLLFWYILYKITGFFVEDVLMNIFPGYITLLSILSVFLIMLVLLPISIMLSHYLSNKLFKK